MAKIYPYDRYDSSTDNDSGIRFDYDYSFSGDLNAPMTRSMKSAAQIHHDLCHEYSNGRVVRRAQPDNTPLIRFPFDGISERIRPVTMRNSENGDYVLCHTNRGTYVAYRTPIVPEWVVKLVHDIERLQR